MDEIFRLSGAVHQDPVIDTWFDAQVPDLGEIARRWFDRMRERGDDVHELIHDGCPTACIGDAAFGYVNVFRAHVNVGFFRGAELPDPAGLLEGRGRLMRHVKVRPGAELASGALEALIDAAYAQMRLALEPWRPARHK